MFGGHFLDLDGRSDASGACCCKHKHKLSRYTSNDRRDLRRYNHSFLGSESAFYRVRVYFHGSGLKRACRVSRVTGNHSPGGNEATWSLGQAKPWSLVGYEASTVFNLLKGILIRFQRYPERYYLGGNSRGLSYVGDAGS